MKIEYKSTIGEWLPAAGVSATLDSLREFFRANPQVTEVYVQREDARLPEIYRPAPKHDYRVSVKVRADSTEEARRKAYGIFKPYPQPHPNIVVERVVR